MSPYAPAIYFADAHYIVPSIYNEKYLDTVLDICCKEKIDAITTLIDPEIEILAANRNVFESIGVQVLAPYSETAALCFDKYKLFQYLKSLNIPTANTYGSFSEAHQAIND